MITYWIFVSIVWATGYILYWLFLKNTAAHKFNRFYINGLLGLGLILPVLPRWEAPPAIDQLVSPIPVINLTGLTIRPDGNTFLASYPSWDMALYLSGFFIGLCYITYALTKLIRIWNSSKSIRFKDTELTIRETQKKHGPFSIHRFLFVSNWNSLSSLEQQAIIDHEKTHWKLGHFFDNVYSLNICLFAWFNPLAYIIRSELRLIHEYQADSETLRALSTRDYKTILLRQHQLIPDRLISNSFIHSPLKSRFIMMKNHFSRSQSWRLLFASAALITLCFACTKENISTEDINTLDKQNINSKISKENFKNIGEVTGETVDTITVFDPETNEETTEIVRNISFANGETRAVRFALDQNTNTNSEEELYVRSKRVYNKVDQSAYFPCSNCTGSFDEIEKRSKKKMLQFIYSNIQYPKDAQDTGIEGMVVVNFVIGTDGAILQPTIKKSVSPSLDKAAIEAILKMPDWIPAKKAGNIVQSSYNIPIKFKLQ